MVGGAVGVASRLPGVRAASDVVAFVRRPDHERFCPLLLENMNVLMLTHPCLSASFPFPHFLLSILSLSLLFLVCCTLHVCWGEV